MNAGHLRHHIRIDRAAKPWPVVDGEPVPEWAEYSKPWAELKPVSARELVATGLTVARETVTVEMRYSSLSAVITANEEWRMVYRDRQYDIRHADTFTRRHQGAVTLICEARSDA